MSCMFLFIPFHIEIALTIPYVSLFSDFNCMDKINVVKILCLFLINPSNEIEILSIGGNNLNHFTTSMISKALSSNKRVIHLGAMRNKLDIPSLLSSKHNLRDFIQVLDISGCRLHSLADMLPIVSLLYDNDILQDLNLSCNNFCSSTVGTLLKAVSSNTALRVLQLRNNMITYRCRRSIIELLQANSTLVTLDLRYNKIPEITRQTIIQEALCDCESVESILSSNHTCGVK